MLNMHNFKLFMLSLPFEIRLWGDYGNIIDSLFNSI